MAAVSAIDHAAPANTDTTKHSDEKRGSSPGSEDDDRVVAVGVQDAEVYRAAMPRWRFQLRQRVMQRLDAEMGSLERIQVRGPSNIMAPSSFPDLDPPRSGRRPGGRRSGTSTLSRPALQAHTRKGTLSSAGRAWADPGRHPPLLAASSCSSSRCGGGTRTQKSAKGEGVRYSLPDLLPIH